MRKWLSVWSCCLLLVCSAQAATVRYFSGEIEEGRVELTPKGFTLGSKGGTTTTLDLVSIMELTLQKSTGSPSTLPAGVMLINGTTIADGTIPPLEGAAVEIGAEHLAVPVAAIGAVLMTSLPREKIEANPAGQTGALLPNGDFFPGTFLGIKGAKVTLNSTLFGPQSFNSKSQISAAFLRDSKPLATRFVLSTTHGSRFLLDDLQMDGAGVMFKDSLLGAIKIKREDLAALHAGTGRYKWLGELAPTIAVSPGVDANTALRLPKDRPKDDDAAPLTFSTAANATLSYAIPAGFTAFVTSVSLPYDAPATARVVFSVYGDGRPLFRTPPFSPSDKPARIRVDLRGVRVLAIRVEPSTLSSASFGDWIGPVLLR